MSAAQWTFYDNHRAFPTLGRSNVGEVWISHAAEGGGGLGEFGIEWKTLGDGLAAQLRVHHDGWSALAESGVVPMLARFSDDDDFTVEVCMRELAALGMKDVTDEIRGGDPRYRVDCPKCHGAGSVVI